MQYDVGLVWFRRDLRLTDNTALAAALSQCRRVYCAFIFNRAILGNLPAADRRVDFIHRSLIELDASLRRRGSALLVRHANATEAIVELAAQLDANAVFANADYEPYAKQRDQQVSRALLAQQRELLQFKDHVIFEKSEVLTNGKTPFNVSLRTKTAG